MLPHSTMEGIRRWAAIFIAAGTLGSCQQTAIFDPPPKSASSLSNAELLRVIARDIESLKARFPQLADFTVANNLHPERLMISYAYRTHPSADRPGWVGGVPNPNDDGVWFYIDLHDPDSMAQIHTQPVVPRYHYRDQPLMLVVLEGANTQALSASLVEIITRHGVQADAAPR